MESQVSGLAKFGLGKSCPESNMHHHTYHFANSTYILHIAYNIVHIILSYAMRPWNHGLYIRNSINEGST